MPRWLRFATGFWLAAAFLVWNGFFDILVTRGEKQYLLNQARHELGISPATSMDAVMTETIHDAVVKASIWGVIVFVSGLAACAYVRRLARRDAGAPGQSGTSPAEAGSQRDESGLKPG